MVKFSAVFHRIALGQRVLLSWVAQASCLCSSAWKAVPPRSCPSSAIRGKTRLIGRVHGDADMNRAKALAEHETVGLGPGRKVAGTETGTQLVLTAATAPWYPVTHAKSSAKSTRRAGVPCAEPIGRQEAPLRQGRRLRGVPAGHDRGAPAAADPHPVLLRLVQPLALRRLAGRRRPGDGLLPLAGTHACDALEGRAPDRRVRSSVSGTVQELPSAERRTSVDRLAVH